MRRLMVSLAAAVATAMVVPTPPLARATARPVSARSTAWPVSTASLRRRSLLASGASWLAAAGSARAANMPVSNGASDKDIGQPRALAVVLQLRKRIATAEREAEAESTVRRKAQAVVDGLRSVESDERKFKAQFDAFSDRVAYKTRYMDSNAFLVYYTSGFDGPGRPAMVSDESVVSMQNGYRNDAWTAVLCAREEAQYLIGANSGADDTADLAAALRAASRAVDAYVKLAPAAVVEAAEGLTGA